jgi:hypothetical protein
VRELVGAQQRADANFSKRMSVEGQQ